jgi:hypothetical protein
MTNETLPVVDFSDLLKAVYVNAINYCVNLEKAEEKFAKLAKRAKKLGVRAPYFE